MAPLCFITGLLTILTEVRTYPPLPGARALALLDDVKVIFLLEGARDTVAIAKTMLRLQERLALKWVQLNRSKSQVLLAGGITPNDLLEIQPSTRR